MPAKENRSCDGWVTDVTLALLAEAGGFTGVIPSGSDGLYLATDVALPARPPESGAGNAPTAGAEQLGRPGVTVGGPDFWVARALLRHGGGTGPPRADFQK